MIPSIVRNVIYPAHEAFLHRPTFSYLAELEKSQWLSRDDIEQLQLRKLRALLHIAYHHCPWHRDRIMNAGIELNHDAPLSRSDLLRLPAMTKRDALDNREQIVWRDVPGGAFKYNTGGSSGQPLIFYYGRSRQASDAAGRMRARRWWGVDAGDREVYLWGAPVELNKTDRIKTVRDRLFNQLVLNAFEMSPENIDRYIEAIQAYRPKCIYGYASSIALLAARARERNIRMSVPGLKAVCTTGEPLYEHQRNLIRQIFGVPVANEFGSRDIGFTAHETPQGQMLLMSESIILEILDPQGRPVAPGEIGEAVMTGLCSDAQPFIRYRTGDMMRRSDEHCRAGRGLEVIGDIMGRTTDFVVRSDGTIMHALGVIYVLRAVEGIDEFKFIQHTLDTIEVLVVPGRKWSETCTGEILAGLRARLGHDIRVDLRVVEVIAPEASGKHRYVVSHVPLQGGLNIARSVTEEAGH